MGFKAKESVAFIKKEVVEGDATYPTAASDAIALQEQPAIDPGVTVLTNEEFVGGIDKSEDVAGPETPSVPLSHYLRHSGVEGTAPNYSELLEASFGGLATPAQKALVAGSTAGTATVRATLKFADAVGLEQLRPFLVKDGMAGFSIRFAHSISGNDALLNFNLPGAPATGVLTGTPIFYRPDSTHPTLALHSHNANEACYQIVRGLRVVNFSAEGTAEELINQSFQLEGLETYFDPIKITATSKYIDFVDDTGTRQAILTEKVYGTPELLAEEISAKMTAASLGFGNDTITATWSASTGKFTIASNGSTTFSLLWLSGAQTANSAKTKLGFNNTDDTGGFTYTSDLEQDWSATGVHGFSPTVDDEGPLVCVDNEFLFAPADQFNDFLCVSARAVTFTLANTKVVTQSICEPTGKEGSSIVLREPQWTTTINIKKHETRYIDAMKRAKDVAVQWTFGVKDGAGNWIPGRCGAIYSRQAKVTSHVVGTTDEEVTVEINISGFGKGSTVKSCAMGLL